MYEEFYGFSEKPFSLTSDPRYLYRSETHASAFDLLQYAMRRREGFVVVTGDIGVGKTTLCRALLSRLEPRTLPVVVLNPFISEEDLLRLILQNLGLVSREEVRRGRLAGVTKQELINALNDFLLSLQRIDASALLIVDEAQNLPLQVLEQIRLLSNLETDKEKLLRIVLFGQPALRRVLRLPDLRQLDQRVSLRLELRPLTRDETAAYVSHRLAIAGGLCRVSFSLRALHRIHALTGGVPRLINLVCDRALLAAFSTRAIRIEPDLIDQAAGALDLEAPVPLVPEWANRRVGALAAGAAALAMAAAAFAYGFGYMQGADSVEPLDPPQVLRAPQ